MLLSRVAFSAPVDLPGDRTPRREAHIGPGLGSVEELRLVPVLGTALVRASAAGEMSYYPLTAVVRLVPLGALVLDSEAPARPKRPRVKEQAS